MGSIYVSPVFHARCETQGCLDLNQQYPRSLLTSSSPSLVYMVRPASPISILATKHLTKFPSTDFQLQHLAIAADRAAPIKAMQSSYMSSISPSASNSTQNDGKAPLTLSEQWREIQGEKHWEGLLDHPIHATLRAEIIRYGEFAQVCYDAFDFNQHSLYCGSCKYNRRVLFEKVDKGGCGYEVTKYLYATSKLDLPKFFKKSERNEEEKWSCDSNWIGYVAVCTDEAEVRRIGRRDILIAWRGTVTRTEWVDDLMTTQAPANIELAMIRPVNRPFYNAPSRIQNANAKLAESHPPAIVKPANAASQYSPLNPNVASIVPSQCPPTMNVELHSRPQDGEGMNVKVDNKTGATNTTYQLAHNDRPAATSNEDVNEVVKVESGFLSLYSSSKATSRFNKLSAGQQMAMEVKRLLQKYEGEEISISITGHSLGAALALLCAYDIAANVALPTNTAVPENTTPAAIKLGSQSTPNVAANPLSTPIPLDIVMLSQTEINGAANQAASSCTSRLNEAASPILAANQSAEPLTVVGNSASSSTKATNVAAPPEVAAKRTGSSPLITVFAFAGPRVGNRAFKRRLEEVGVRVLRIVNVHDCVPRVPGVLFNEHSPKVWPNTSGYHHVGKELLIDFDVSPHLRHTRDLASHHNLEAHLHVLDGFHGFTRPFQSVFRRNPVLVNKSSDFLQKEAFIPPSWWQESNKGLVKDPLSGQWVLASREDDHLPEIHHPEPPHALTG